MNCSQVIKEGGLLIAQKVTIKDGKLVAIAKE
jgi:hypothetical protein